jgi:hypothetical protein
MLCLRSECASRKCRCQNFVSCERVKSPQSHFLSLLTVSRDKGASSACVVSDAFGVTVCRFIVQDKDMELSRALCVSP